MHPNKMEVMLPQKFEALQSTVLLTFDKGFLTLINSAKSLEEILYSTLVLEKQINLPAQIIISSTFI